MAARWSGCGSDLERTLFLFTTQLSLCTVPPAVRQLVAAQVSLHCYGQPNSGKGRLYVNCGALKEQCGIVKENDFYTKENNKNVEMNTHWSPYMPDQTDRTFFLRNIIAARKRGSVKASLPLLVERSAKITSLPLGQQQLPKKWLKIRGSL